MPFRYCQKHPYSIRCLPGSRPHSWSGSAAGPCWRFPHSRQWPYRWRSIVSMDTLNRSARFSTLSRFSSDKYLTISFCRSFSIYIISSHYILLFQVFLHKLSTKAPGFLCDISTILYLLFRIFLSIFFYYFCFL